MTNVVNPILDNEIYSRCGFKTVTIAGDVLWNEDECAAIDKWHMLKDVDLLNKVNECSDNERTLESVKSKRRKMGYVKKRGRPPVEKSDGGNDGGSKDE